MSRVQRKHISLVKGLCFMVIMFYGLTTNCKRESVGNEVNPSMWQEKKSNIING